MTRIYKLGRSVDVRYWLCDAHLAHRLALGWEKREVRDPPHQLECSDCYSEEEGA